MMSLPSVASGSATPTKAAVVAGANAEAGENTASFVDAQQGTRAQLADTTSPKAPAATELSVTNSAPAATDKKSAAEGPDDELINGNSNAALGDAALESATSVEDTLSDKNLSDERLSDAQLSAEQVSPPADEELLGVAIYDDGVSREPLAEPSTQLWHWHYSRQARAEQGQASTEAITAEQSGLEQASVGKISTEQANAEQANVLQTHAGQANAGQTSANQASVQEASSARVNQASLAELSVAQSATDRGQGVSGQAVSSLPDNKGMSAADKGMAASFLATQATSNKLLIQQLGPNFALAGASHSEEASSLQTHTLASLVNGAAHGRAGVPVHEWASVTLDANNKATLGMQLVQALKEKVELQLNQEVQQARIKLDPPEMGRLELSIRLEGDKLHIHIAASSGAVRDALNAQADRLRNDLLPHHGGGVEVSVGQEGQSQQSSSPQFDNAILLAEQASTELEQKQQAGSGWINALV